MNLDDVRPDVRKTTAVKKGPIKVLGQSIDNTKDLILKCNNHCENRIENYCEGCDSVCCYGCATYRHTQCTVIPIDEAAVRLCDSEKLHQKYNDLRQIQSKVFDTIQAIDTEIANHSKSYTDSRRDLLDEQTDKTFREKYSLGSRLSEATEKLKRVHVLCRELEDIVNVTLKSYKFSVSRKSDVVAFVVCMKNKQRIITLINELCIIHADGSIDNPNLKDQKHCDDGLLKIERDLEQLTCGIEDFIHTLKKTYRADKDHYLCDPGLSHGKGQESKQSEHTKSVDRTDSDVEDLMDNFRELKVSKPTKLGHDIKPDLLVKSENKPLAVIPFKVTRNSTKSLHGKRHRVIRYSDTENYLNDENDECKTNSVDDQSTAPSLRKELEKDGTVAELTPRKDEEVNEEKTELLLEDEGEDENEELPVHIAEEEIPPPTGNTFLRESAIVFDVLPDGIRIASRIKSERRPYSRDIVLSTNRIKTKTCSPPGFHGQSVQVQHKLKLVYAGDVCIRLPSDSYPCSINGLTCMPDGKVVVSDFNNCCLKIFSSRGRYMSHLPTKFPPFSVVCISNSLLMFAYGLARNIIGLVSVTSGLEIRQEFTTEHACVALASNNTFVYVLCKSEYRTEVHILNTEGVVNMKIDLGIQIPSPQFITVDPLSEMIYITDYKGVFGIERTGSKMIFLEDSPISRYTGVAADSCGNLFVCTEFPDGVYSKPQDKNYLKPLLLGQSVKKIHAICFNEINNSLIMSFFDSDYIRQYKIMSD